jgi:hypothetical protein
MDILLCTTSDTIIVVLFYFILVTNVPVFLHLKFIMYNVKVAHCRRVSYNVETILYAKWLRF